ncbi:MAG: FAD-dependent oxidoreductase, partial [Ferrovibrio sp.]
MTETTRRQFMAMTTAATLLPALGTHAAVLPSETEVVIVGAGLAGLSAARMLQDRGRNVVVLEARGGGGGGLGGDCPTRGVAGGVGGGQGGKR